MNISTIRTSRQVIRSGTFFRTHPFGEDEAHDDNGGVVGDGAGGDGDGDGEEAAKVMVEVQAITTAMVIAMATAMTRTMMKTMRVMEASSFRQDFHTSRAQDG